MQVLENLQDSVAFIGVDSNKLDDHFSTALQTIAQLPGVQKPLIVLPDFHYKPHMETPSSFAVATKDYVYPSLTSTGLNCGMGVVKTSLKEEDLDQNFLDDFYKGIGKHGKIARSAIRFGLQLRRKDKYELTPQELQQTILKGPEVVCKKFGLDPKDFVPYIEQEGKLKGTEDITEEDIAELLPSGIYTQENYGFGDGFFSNHFLELQIVDEICDEAQAKAWGLEKGQVVFMFHGGGGDLTYYEGRYYANRTKVRFSERIALFYNKLLFHILNVNGMKNFKQRWQLYFRRGLFIGIPVKTPEGRRAIKAMTLAMNYGYAFRLGKVARIKDRIAKVRPQLDVKYSLLYDCSHNSIQHVNDHNEDLWVHRHNAIHVYPGKPTILAGMNTTSSYIGVGLEGAKKTFYSADHGAGTVIKRYEQQGVAKPKPQYVSKVYSPRKEVTTIKTVPHQTDEGIDYIMNLHVQNNIAKPVVKLRPLATLKAK